jgi:hypothetical protein
MNFELIGKLVEVQIIARGRGKYELKVKRLLD